MEAERASPARKAKEAWAMKRGGEARRRKQGDINKGGEEGDENEGSMGPGIAGRATSEAGPGDGEHAPPPRCTRPELLLLIALLLARDQRKAWSGIGRSGNAEGIGGHGRGFPVAYLSSLFWFFFFFGDALLGFVFFFF